MTMTRREVGGVALVVSGILAMPVPIIPGIPIIAAGVGLLGPNHPVVRKCRTWLQNKGIWRKEGETNDLSNV